MKKKRFLVTGGTGFIGASLVRRLVKEGNYVRVLDNNVRGVKTRLDLVRSKIDLVEADVRDADAVRRACKGIDIVCHLAFINGTEYFYSKPELVLDVGVKGMINVIDGCIHEGVKELITASSSEVYQSPKKVPTDETVPLIVPDVQNPRYSYGGGKIISELMAINYGRKFFKRSVIFRPHNVYGPDMGYEHVIPQFILRMRDMLTINSAPTVDFPIQGDGSETRSFIYIDDFIDGLMHVIDKGEHLGIYHIGTMDEVSIGDVARLIGDHFGRNVSLITSPVPRGATPRRCPDNSKLKRLGFKPRVSLKEGLKKTIRWYDTPGSKKGESRVLKDKLR